MKSGNIDIAKILKRAYEIVIKNKYLWLLGLLAGGGGISLYNGGSGFSGLDQENIFKGGEDISVNRASDLAGKVLGDYTGITSDILMAIVIAVLIFAIIMIYLSITAKGAILSAVDEIDADKKVALGEAWRSGKKYFWRLFWLSVITSLIVFVPIAVVVGVSVALYLSGLKVTAVIIGVLFALVFVIGLIYLSLFYPYAERMLVLENISTTQSLKDGVAFFNKNWKEAVIMYLVMIAVNIGISFVLLIVGSIIVIVLGLLGVAIYYASHVLVWIYAVPVGLVLIAILLIISGIIASYNSAVYTLTYKEIKKS